MYIMSYCYENTWAVMALVDSIVVRFIWLDGYNIFISALKLFLFLMLYSFLPLTPRWFCVTVLVGGYVNIFFQFFWFSYQAVHTFSIVHFDLKVPVVSVGGHLALAWGGAAPSLIPCSGLWWVCPHLCWDTVLVFQVFPSFICFN